MSKPNYLLDHLLDSQSRDHVSPILVGHDDPNRLRFRYCGVNGDWNTVATFISDHKRWPVAWIPDANVAIRDAATPVWDALRAAALGNPKSSTIITSVIEAELTEWLNLPYRNQKRAAAITAGLDGGTWIKKFRIGMDTPYNTALYGYAHLLGFRRLAARKTRAGTTLVDTDPGDKGGTMNAIRKKLGPRAQALAKKGRIDAEASGKCNISDEMNVLMAVLYALLNKRDSVILTADVDFVEIYYKTQWFLDTHYRAWLAANMIKNGLYGSAAGLLDDTKGYFDGPLTLYKRPTYHLREVLPADSSAVMVGLLYVAPDGILHMAFFPFELKMLEMLKTRSATNGRCTDLFGDSNLHIDLGPLKYDVDGVYLGIGKDCILEFNTNGVRSRASLLDLEQSICCFEGFSSC